MTHSLSENGWAQRKAPTWIPLIHLPMGISVCPALVLETGSKEAGNRKETAEIVMNLHLTDNQHIFHFIRIVPNLALPEY